MEQTQVPKLSLWIGLTRPRTLFSGLSSVLTAIFYAISEHRFSWLPASLLILIAVLAQIASNIANDLIDYRKGADTEERKGPLRPLSKGLLTESEVRNALMLSLVLLLVVGLMLIALTGAWWLMAVAVAVVLGVFAYSGGPYPLSYKGLGDLAVLIFFGIIPITVSNYVLGGSFADTNIWHLAISVGLASVNILVVNNYRDYEEDKKVGKQTLIVRMGKDFGPRLYLSCGLLSMLLLYPFFSAWGMVGLMGYLLLFTQTYHRMVRTEGRALNKVLGLTARNVLVLVLLIGGLLLLK